MLKVKVRWQGFTGSPGWSNFYFDDATGDFLTNAEAVAAVSRVQTFFNAVKAYFPPTVQWAIQSDVEQVHSSTGEMFGIETVTAPAVISGSATAANYSAASGVVVTWRTAGVRNGRRVRGRTFLVPAASYAYETDGSIGPTPLSTFNTAATALIDAAGNMPLGVWSRPTAPGAEDGDWFPATSASIPDKVAVLRSRRD